MVFDFPGPCMLGKGESINPWSTHGVRFPLYLIEAVILEMVMKMAN
jgi:hypothetical protein